MQLNMINLLLQKEYPGEKTYNVKNITKQLDTYCGIGIMDAVNVSFDEKNPDNLIVTLTVTKFGNFFRNIFQNDLTIRVYQINSLQVSMYNRKVLNPIKIPITDDLPFVTEESAMAISDMQPLQDKEQLHQQKSLYHASALFITKVVFLSDLFCIQA